MTTMSSEGIYDLSPLGDGALMFATDTHAVWWTRRLTKMRILLRARCVLTRRGISETGRRVRHERD